MAISLRTLCAGAFALASLTAAHAQDASSGTPIDEGYREQFHQCDTKDVFRGVALQGHHRCSSDPSNVTELTVRKDHGVVWRSKMSLDVDGSWAAWNGVGGRTDQKETSMKWAAPGGPKSQAAQLDPDQIPFVVIPTSTEGTAIADPQLAKKLASEFHDKTGLAIGDWGVVIYGDKWTPAVIGDGGPFNKLGEASSQVFRLVGVDRCRKWSPDGKHCVGDGRSDPYKDVSAPDQATYIFYPHTAMNADNAVSVLCTWAKDTLKRSGSPACP